MRSHVARALLVVTVAASFAAAVTAPALAGPSRCPETDTMPGDASEAALATSTVCLVNRERTRRGLRPLRKNRRLSKAAISHTRDMVNRSYFQHVSRTGLDVVDRLNLSGYLARVRSWAVGENLAWGTGTRSTPRGTVIAWMRSPGHRRNILNRHFREIGIGVVFDAPNSRAAVAATYTTTFGRRR